MPKRGSFAAALASSKPLSKSISLCLDGELLAEAESLGEQFRQAQNDDERLNRVAEAPQIARRLAEVADRIRETEVEFTFRSLGRLAWRDLVSEHPPTKEHEQVGLDFNPDTLPAAAMAACCVAPEDADLEGFRQLSETLTQTQWDRLWLTCREANLGAGDIPNLAAAYALARPTETSSD
jgi:hypothetical protein